MDRRVPGIPGARDLYSLLDFLKDPKLYQDRMDALAAKHAECVAATAAVGKIEEVEKLYEQATHEAGVARDKMTSADAEIAEMKKTARAELAKQKDAWQAKYSKEKAAHDERVSKVASREAVIEKRETEVFAREKTINGVVAEAEKMRAEGAEAKERYEAMMAQITAVTNG